MNKQSARWDINSGNNFDFLRFMFAILVIFGHSWQYLYGLAGDNPNEPLLRLTHGQVTEGAVAVDAFFAFSGFLLTRSWLSRPDPRAFLTKRALRIYPGFFAAAVVFWCIGGFLAGQKSPLTLSLYLEYMRHLDVPTLIHGALRLDSIDVIMKSPHLHFVVKVTPTWTIRYEGGCYILLTCLGIIGALKFPGTGKKGIGSVVRFVLPVILIGVYAVCWFFDLTHFNDLRLGAIAYRVFLGYVLFAIILIGVSRGSDPVKSSWIRRSCQVVLFAAFAFAVIILLFSRRHPHAADALLWPGVVPLFWDISWMRFLTCFLTGSLFYLLRERIPQTIGIFLFSVVAIVAASIHGSYLFFVLPTFGVYVCLYLALNPRLRFTQWTKWVGGDYSYGIYLYAGMIQTAVARHFATYFTPVTFFLFCCPLSILCGALSWHIVEKRFINMRRHSKS